MKSLEEAIASRHLAVSSDWNPADALRALRTFLQSPTRKIRILVVDDEPCDLELLGFRLEKFDCQVFQSKAPSEAIRLIEQNDYDMVFVDLKLPPRDGIEVIRQVRKFKPKTRFVVTSGHPNLIELVSEMGGLFIFRKPITDDDLELLFGTMEGSPYG